MSADISLYNTHPDEYNDIQNLRPDYKKAIEMTVELAIKYMHGKNSISIADFCGGTGAITKKIADIINIDKAKIVDTNQEFLNIAERADIKTKKLETACSDILDIKLDREYDLILSIFAYHHIPDDKKEKYLKQVVDGLKESGILILTEIYLPNKKITLNYYHKLLDEMSEKSPILEKFITETAESTDYEFKVSRGFADRQMTELGLTEIECIKIWPLDNTLDKDIGTFVQIFKNTNKS